MVLWTRVHQQVESKTPEQPSGSRYIKGKRPTTIDTRSAQPGRQGIGGDCCSGNACVRNWHESCSFTRACPACEEVIEGWEGQPTGKALNEPDKEEQGGLNACQQGDEQGWGGEDGHTHKENWFPTPSVAAPPTDQLSEDVSIEEGTEQVPLEFLRPLKLSLLFLIFHKFSVLYFIKSLLLFNAVPILPTLIYDQAMVGSVVGGVGTHADQSHAEVESERHQVVDTQEDHASEDKAARAK